MIKIAYNDLVSYKPRKGEILAGLVIDGSNYVAAVKSIWVDEDDGGKTYVSLVGGPDLKYGGRVLYDRKRFTVIEKNGGSIPTPVASDRTDPCDLTEEETAAALAEYEARQSDRAAEARGAAGEVEADNNVSKKARTIALYQEIMARGGKRREGIQIMTSEWGMSPAAASTYWQNCRPNGRWA